MDGWKTEYRRVNLETDTVMVVSQDHHGKWAWDLEDLIHGQRISGSAHVFNSARAAKRAAIKWHAEEWVRELVPIGLYEAAY